VDLVGTRKHILDGSWDAHWRYLANTTEPSMCIGDAAFLSNYFDHLFIVIVIVIIKEFAESATLWTA